MRRLLAVALCVLAPLAWGAEREIPYASMHKVLARLDNLPEGKYFHASARFSSTDPEVPTGAITLVVRSKSGDIPVPIAADGVAGFPLRDDLLAENPPVVTNVGKGHLNVTLDMRVSAPPEQRFRYELLVAMIEEVDAVIAKQGLMARMFAPDFGGLQAQFPAGTAATATVEAAKPETFTADAEGRIRIPDRKSWRKENPFVQLSGAPQSLDLYTE